MDTTFQDLLSQFRREKGISQEELGAELGVTRQAVQKWESGASRPDMDNLTALSRFFNVSLDYLITGQDPAPAPAQPGQTIINNYYRHRWEYEYKSNRTLWGLPLVHIHLCERGFATAKGVVAIGNVAVGLVSIGIFSAGLLSLGSISLGLLLAVGCLAAGGLAVGGAAVGVVALGGFAYGWLALGGIAGGTYAAGGVVSASRIAIGGVAQAPLAIGAAAEGARTILLPTDQSISPETRAAVREAVAAALDGRHPWLLELFSRLIA